jgi:hypothetical protein
MSILTLSTQFNGEKSMEQSLETRLVAQRYTKVEEIDFDETFAPIAHLESVYILLAIACHLNFKLYQMDMKSATLNRILREKVYVEQPKIFTNNLFPNMYRLKKAFYSLKQTL